MKDDFTFSELYPQPRGNNQSTVRWLVGMGIASFFSFTYILSPIYFFCAIYALLFSYLSRFASFVFASPLIISIVCKPKRSRWIVERLKPMLYYFDYEEVREISNEELARLLYEEKKSFIFAVQPHGVISFAGICSQINEPPALQGVYTAVASSLLHTPILKHVMGIFGLVDASSKNFTKHVRKKGKEGCIFLYAGGIAELFKSSSTEERLYLKKRKGFIKVALREGVDVLPIYLFGNSNVLTILKSGPLATLSRKLQVALTYFWGKYYLPIPVDYKILYVRGKPLGLPHIPEPTNEDVDKWHAKYCEQVEYLFEKYKEKVPMYKHKKLFID